MVTPSKLNRHSPQREQQDLDRLRDKLAKGWAAGLSAGQIGARLGLTKGAVIGLVNRARTHGDDRFRPRLADPRPKPKPKVRRLKPVDEAVGNSRALPPEPLEPPRPVPFLALPSRPLQIPAELTCARQPLRRDDVLRRIDRTIGRELLQPT